MSADYKYIFDVEQTLMPLLEWNQILDYLFKSLGISAEVNAKRHDQRKQASMQKIRCMAHLELDLLPHSPLWKCLL